MPVQKSHRSAGTSPCLSVITVCLQAAPALAKTVASVSAENMPGVEHIVVDGGSTDGTRAVLKKYRSKIATSVSEPDQGIYHAMNKGVALARGRWLFFLNAGDTLRPGALAKLLAAAESAPPDAGLVCGRVAMTDAEGAPLGYTFPRAKGDAATLPRDNCVAHQATLIRASTFRRHGLFSPCYAIAGDYEYWLRLLGAGVRFVFVDQIVSDFPDNGASSSRELYTRAHRECMLIRVQHGHLALHEAALRHLTLRAVFALKNALRAALGARISRAIRLARARAKGR